MNSTNVVSANDLVKAIGEVAKLTRTWAGSKVISGDDEAGMRGIDLAHRLEAAQLAAKELSRDTISRPERKVGSDRNKGDRKNSTEVDSRGRCHSDFPAYYIDGEKLIKIGKTRSDDSEDSVYRKTMPMKDAVVLMQLLADFVSSNRDSNSIAIKEYCAFLRDEKVSFPSYKIYLLFGAMEASEVIMPVGRGVYQLKDNHSSPRFWEERIRSLERKEYLMKREK